MSRTIQPGELGKVAVLMGGHSAERAVSLKSGAAVLAALLRRGVDAQALDCADPLTLCRLQDEGFSRAFVVLHGRGGEDGVMQGALASIGMPYTGSGVLASALGMDKWRSKMLWQAAGLPVPRSLVLDADSDPEQVCASLGLPLFVKPAREGSSVGISKVERLEELPAALQLARQHDELVLAEQNCGGGEFTVAILDGRALPVVKIESQGAFYDYEAKYLRDDTRYLCPCGLTAEQESAMQQLALQAFAVLGCRGWGRIDILLDGQAEMVVLEANTVPGMTDHSLLPMAAAAAGVEFDELVWRILLGSMRGEDAYAA
jgi:D-alanine-D-alanine ligase